MLFTCTIVIKVSLLHQIFNFSCLSIKCNCKIKQDWINQEITYKFDRIWVFIISWSINVLLHLLIKHMSNLYVGIYQFLQTNSSNQEYNLIHFITIQHEIPNTIFKNILSYPKSTLPWPSSYKDTLYNTHVDFWKMKVTPHIGLLCTYIKQFEISSNVQQFSKLIFSMKVTTTQETEHKQSCKVIDIHSGTA